MIQNTGNSKQNKTFTCIECNQIYNKNQRFEQTPICISCATENGLTKILQEERMNSSNSEDDIQATVKDTKIDRADELMPIKETSDKGKEMKIDCKVTEDDWEKLPGGEFLMGSAIDEPSHADDERIHRVDIKAFKIMSTPVTFEQYDVFCTATGRDPVADKGWGRGSRPVIYVSYWDAVDYAIWLSTQTTWSCRLPTEAEWEYACRAGSDTPFNTGHIITCAQANYDGIYTYGQGVRSISRWRTLPVRSFPENEWGIADMHGNIWEWCSSEYDPDYSGLEMMDASFDRMNNVPRSLRGGSWHSRPEFLRSACRYRFEPVECGYEWGFRLVCSE